MKLSSKVKTRRETYVKKRGKGTPSEGEQFRQRTEMLKSMKELYRERGELGYVLESGI